MVWFTEATGCGGLVDSLRFQKRVRTQLVYDAINKCIIKENQRKMRSARPSSSPAQCETGK
jgi:hypothetical protein